MGYAVLHLEKAKGTDSRMSAHIERTVHPKNADRTRTHLNRELVQFPEGVRNRTQAIAHRIETAGIRRKVSANQVKAIRILLTGSNKDMKQMEAEGRIEDWCNDSLKWIRETYGEQNLVSAVLHMDEKTPHIHATVIPIVTGERRKAGQEEQNGKKKYRKKNPQDVRLCADDVMARHRLKHYQDTYAQAMNKYGLQRGVDGSLAKHISTMQYYKQLVEQQDSLQENIENLLGLEEEAMKKLKQVKGEINVQKMKGAAVNATTAIADGVSSLFGGSKVKRLEEENENLKRNIVNLQKQVQAEQREQTKMENRHSSEIKLPAQNRTIPQSAATDRHLLSYCKGTDAHSRTMPGSGLHRRTDKTNCQPATRGVQGKALFKGVQGEVQDGALNGNSGEEPAGERKIQAVH